MTPDRLGKYEIRGTLGQGAMGLVYDGWDPLILRRVAIKTVSLAQGDDADMAEGVERFRREAQAAGRLQHPNIVSVFDFGETDTLAYIVMEFMDGGTLKDVLDQEKRVAPQRASDMMGQVLAALSYSHARGVIHRDVKPANIMLNAQGQVKLGDFGIARLESSSMTLVGDVLGTPAYMAPEQFLGETADARSDIFAAGATLFHLLTGTRPYEGSRTTVRQKVLTAVEAPSASERAPDVPPALDAVLRRAMARQPADRFQDANDFAAAVRAALIAPPADDAGESDSTIIARAPSADATQATSRRPAPPPAAPAPAAPAKRGGAPIALLAGLGVVVLAAGAGGFWYFTQSPSTPAPTPAPHAPQVVTPPEQKPLANIAPAKPPPPPPPSPAEAARAAAGADGVEEAEVAAATVDCALARVQPAAAAITVSGIAGAGGPSDALREAIAKASAGLDTNWAVQHFAGPYCTTLNAIRAAWLAGDMQLGLQNQHDDGVAGSGTVLTKDQLMKPVIAGLGFPAWLRVDDMQADGTVVHMYPQVRGDGFHADAAKLLAAGDRLVLGRDQHNPFQVGSPYGTDLVIAVASSEKLLAAPRKNVEQAAPYLAALRAAIDTAASHGAHLAAAAMPVETSEK